MAEHSAEVLFLELECQFWLHLFLKGGNGGVACSNQACGIFVFSICPRTKWKSEKLFDQSEVGKMKLENMVCCAWHKPTNAIVELISGRIIPKRKLRAIPSSPEKDLMIGSGGMCDPCAANFISKSKYAKIPQDEDLLR